MDESNQSSMALTADCFLVLSSSLLVECFRAVFFEATDVFLLLLDDLAVEERLLERLDRET